MSSVLRAASLVVTSAATLSGSAGFDVDALSCTVSTVFTLPSAVTNRVRNSLTLTAQKTNTLAVKCSTVNGIAAILKLDTGASQEVAYVAATDIDSSAGSTIWNWQGTNTRTTNWSQYTAVPATVAATFIG